MIKVLVVDDSKLIRALVTEMINQAPDMQVIGEAEDPFDAREKIKQFNPDVITLDIEMPRMDGITFLKNLMRLRPMPVVMLSTLTAEGAPITLEALEIGAVDFLEKPKINVVSELPQYRDVLQEKLRTAARANVRRPALVNPQAKQNQTLLQSNWETLKYKSGHLVAIGASTGGTEAIKDIITRLPANFPPVVITQHIPPVFSTTYAKRLDSISNMHVFEAFDGQVIEVGSVYIAPGDQHMQVVKKGNKLVCRLSSADPVNRHRPSVEVMFESIIPLGAKNVSAAILTGMGADGAKSLLHLKDAGAYTIAQNEATCVVFGMPKAAIDIAAASKVLALDKIAKALVQQAAKT